MRAPADSSDATCPMRYLSTGDSTIEFRRLVTSLLRTPRLLWTCTGRESMGTAGGLGCCKEFQTASANPSARRLAEEDCLWEPVEILRYSLLIRCRIQA